MKRLVAYSAFFVLSAALIAFAVDRDPTVFGRDDFSPPPVSRSAPAPALAFQLEAATPLSQRQQLLDRTKAKIELMSDEDVQQALEQTDAEIRLMQAKQKLDQTADLLRSIVEEYEGTPAAKIAFDMLAVHERGGEPRYAAPTFDAPRPTRSPIPYPEIPQELPDSNRN
jgi:hypothetical protein